jgi:hypothetical protein
MTTTTTTTFTETEIDRYVGEVAAHLGAVPERERTELLDDLRQHLAEVAAEDDGPLAARVGPPREYAAELLASAGLASDLDRLGPVAKARLLWERVQATAPYRATFDFIPELRPAWWVLRALAAVFALNVLLVNDHERTWPWPEAGAMNRALVLVPLWLAVVASVAVGRWSVSGGRSRLVWLANLAIVPLALVAVVAMGDGRSDFGEPSTTYIRSTGYVATDGTPLTNIYPYDAQGRLLDGVLLYDERGMPIDLRQQSSDAGVRTDVPLGADGQPITNSFPYRQEPLGTGGTAVPPPGVSIPSTNPSPPVTPAG